MSKTYQIDKKEHLPWFGVLVAWLVIMGVILWPVFQVWGISWWGDAICVVVVLLTLGAFWIGLRLFLSTFSLKLEMDSDGLGEHEWRKSWRVSWAEVTAWCATAVGEGEDEVRYISLRSVTRTEPFEIDPVLLGGKEFKVIYHEIEKHCGPPRPGAEIVGENDGLQFRDIRI
jgi:hypothetical protein